MRGTDTNPQPYQGGESGRVAELEELVNSYATTNETQRKRIDELLDVIAKANRRVEAAEAKLAAVPVNAITTVVRSLDDGPYSDDATDAVVSWLDSVGALG